MSRIQSVLSAQRVNHEGFPTFLHGKRDQVRNFLRTGTLSGTFYVQADQLAAESLRVLCELGHMDANALAEETVSAREEGYMRTLPILACVVLSALPNKELFRQTAARVLKTPRDAAQFVEICASGAVPGRSSFGGCSVAPVRDFLARLSEWHALKGTQHGAFALRDLVRLSHPAPADEIMRERLGWVTGRVSADRVEQNGRLRAFEALKRAATADEAARLVREAGLPYEAVTAAVNRPELEVWEELLRVAPTFNLLRSLATFQRHGVFAKDANVELAVGKLTREGALRQARILPFRVYSAWQAYRELPGADLRIVAALSDALDASTAELPLFLGRVCIAPDVSGSMTWSQVAGGKTRPIDVASIFAAGLLRRCPNAVVLPFESDVVDVRLNPRDSVLSSAERLASVGGGGTSLSAPVEKLLRERDAVSLFVGITDNEEWVGRGFYDVWREYVSKVSPEAKAVLVTVVPEPYRPVPESEQSVRFVHGWSDAALRYVADVGGAAACRGDDPDEA